jgi:ABC-type proline/glycine betaine transport system ATPase subunit
VVTHDIAATRRVGDYIGMLCRRKLVQFGTASEMFESDIPEVRQFLAGDTEGPIGMAEEKDQEIVSTSGLTAEQTEQLERTASSRAREDPAGEEGAAEDEGPARDEAAGEKEDGSWLFR